MDRLKMHQFVQPHAREFLPCAQGAEQVRPDIARLLDASEKSEIQGLSGEIGLIADDLASTAVTTDQFGNSPFFIICVTPVSEFTARFFESGPQAYPLSIEENRRSPAPAFCDDGELKQALRITKRREAPAIAAAYLTGFMDQRRVVAMLTGFGDTAIADTAEEVFAVFNAIIGTSKD